MDKNDIIKWITENLSTNKRAINPNYTKNNFHLIKTKYPQMWPLLENQKFIINNKEYSFENKIYYRGTINGINIGTEYFYKNKHLHKLLKSLSHNAYISFDDVIKNSIKLKLNGVRLFIIAQKAFPNEYIKLRELYELTKCEGESIYCYYKNINPLFINNKHVNFQYYERGYSYEELCNIYLKEKDDIQMLKQMYNTDSYKMTKFIKEYIPDLMQKINEFEICKYATKMDEKIYIIVNEIYENPKCLMCNGITKFKTLTTGYRDFCSRTCCASYYGLKFRKYRNPQIWNEYNLAITKYTNISYRKYKNIINPQNLPRSVFEYNVDHIIPKIYGFENNIDPKIISHYTNLQMLQYKSNRSKGKKIDDTEKQKNLMNITNKDMEYYNE